jgi:Zn finger protein HypA/HybF involved in hydrogenase expression
LNHIFANTTSVVGFVMQERKQFVVNCKDCRRDVPSGVKEFPFKSIAVTCPLCKEQRRYLPSEVFLGRPIHLEAKQARA